jgi:hypothetical protein
MPIKQGRKVTELTALDSASLNTYVVGVDNNITYKISLDVLEDAVVKIVSSSTDARLDAIETYTASIDVSSLNSSLALTEGRLTSLEQSTSSFFTEENSNPSENNFVAVFGEGINLQKGAIFVTGSRVIVGGPSASVHEFVPEAFAVYSQLDGYNLISGHGTTNNYLQLNIKNFSDLSNASSDVVATADNGTEDSYYVNMGINGSGYDEDTIIGTANDTYIYGYGNVFHVGNAAEYPVYIFAGGFDAKGEHLKMVIDPFDNHIMTGSLEINGNLNTLGDVTASNIYSVNQTISGSVFIYDSYGDFEYPIILQTNRNGSFSISNGPIEAADGLIIAGEKYLKIVNDGNSNYDAYIENINNVGLRISSSTSTDAILELSGYSLNIQNRLTASISEGYIWVGGDMDKTYQMPTSSFDARYVLSGSVQNIELPSNLISSSAQITAFGFVSSSTIIPTGTISGSSQLTSSFDTRYAASGSAPTLFLLEAYANVTYTLPGGFTDDTCRYSIVNNTVNVPSNWFNTSTYRFTPQKAGYWQIIASYDIYRNSEASLAIRKNGGVVAAAGTFNSVAQQVTKIVYLNGSTDYIDVMNTGGASLSRDQYDSRSWFQAKWIGQ